MLERDDALTWLSLRNVADVHLLAVDQLNTYDVLLSDDVIFTKGAYDAFVDGRPRSSRRRSQEAAKKSLRRPRAESRSRRARPPGEEDQK